MRPIDTSVPCRTVGKHHSATLIARINEHRSPQLVWKLSDGNNEYITVTNTYGVGSVKIEEVDAGLIKHTVEDRVRMEKDKPLYLVFNRNDIESTHCLVGIVGTFNTRQEAYDCFHEHPVRLFGHKAIYKLEANTNPKLIISEIYDD